MKLSSHVVCDQFIFNHYMVNCDGQSPDLLRPSSVEIVRPRWRGTQNTEILFRRYILEKSFKISQVLTGPFFSDTSFMMSCYEQMRGNEEIQSRPESGRDNPFDLFFLKVDINLNRVLKVRCPYVSKA